MNGVRFLLDTNAVVALLGGNTVISKLINKAQWLGVSIITVLEYTSFSKLNNDDVDLFHLFLKRIEVIDLAQNNFALLQITTIIRIKHKLKLPDAIIAATSILKIATLITNDKGFDNVNNLKVIGF